MMEWLKEKMTADRDGLSIKTSKIHLASAATTMVKTLYRYVNIVKVMFVRIADKKHQTRRG